MAVEMDDIVAEFVAEAEESLDRVDPLFVELEGRGPDREILNDIFRCVHTLKGAAGFLGFREVVEVAHATESILKKLRDGEIPLSKPLVDAVLRGVDLLRRLIGRIKAKEPPVADIAPVLGELEEALAAASGPGDGRPMRRVRAGPDAAANPPAAPEPGACDPSCAPAPPASRGGSASGARPGPAPAGAPSPPGDPPAAEPLEKKEAARNLRVGVDRIDKVLDLTGEVVLVRNRLLNLAAEIGSRYGDDPAVGSLNDTVSFLDLVTSDMQLAVMKMRMQAIAKVFARFPRVVRDLSAALGKPVDLRVSGEDTEVDRSVIEVIGDPLVHLIRNAIDHGIEPPEVRRAKGKPPRGLIRIDAAQKGNQVVIEVSDDGAGIDLDRVRRKAAEKGLVPAGEAERMPDEAATGLIFLPGFSTVEAATELSGRGVGMDVVKTNVARLNGFVEVRTARDAGTTFRIVVPLTLAITRTLMVRAGGSRYAIPLVLVDQIVRISPGEVAGILGRQVLLIRNRVMPLFDLALLLGRRGADDEGARYAVVVAVGESRFAVAVEALAGEEEVVTKPLDGIEADPACAIGATITGDGQVVLILDLAGIARGLLAPGVV